MRKGCDEGGKWGQKMKGGREKGCYSTANQWVLKRSEHGGHNDLDKVPRGGVGKDR